MKREKLSKISLLHCIRLCIRLPLLIGACIVYVRSYKSGSLPVLRSVTDNTPAAAVLFAMFFAEICMRLFPSETESMGCRKQFKRNYIPSENPRSLYRLSPVRTFIMAAAWIGANGFIGVLYLKGIIDEWLLVMLFLAYSVGDMVCVLFFCPFQWFMRNKCCISCRIYNWDYPMMFTPFVFIRNPYTDILLGMSVILLIRWEITYRRYPQRFILGENDMLICSKCTERICSHKKQIYR